jgi:hypothetical protein
MLAVEAMSGDYSIGSDKWPGTSKLLEEMGELAQVLGKIIGNDGKIVHWDGTNLRVRLIQEMADVTAALEFFRASNLSPTEWGVLFDRYQTKLALFKEWQKKGQ